MIRFICQISFGFLFLMLMGCNSLFFQPDDIVYSHPSQSEGTYQEVYIKSSDQINLHAFILYPSVFKKKAVVVQFHGNGQNMSAHAIYASWLVEEGYHVVTFDYRGYGQSGGTPNRQGAIEDGVRVLDFVANEPTLKDLPLIVLGQSIGGAIALGSIHLSGRIPKVIILDSTFSSYRGVAINLLQNHWLTWPLQWLPYLLVSDEWAPEDLPLKASGGYLFFHSAIDPIVPIEQGSKLFDLAPKPKEFWTIDTPGHIIALNPDSPYRAKLLEFLNSHILQK